MSRAKAKTQVHEISLKSIVCDKDVQPRKEMDLDIAREYSEAMLEGDEFPPIVVFFDGTTYWLADGFYRVRAAQAAEFKSIKAIVHQGEKEDAILFSVGANAAHGLRRSNSDKRNAIFKMLNHPEWSKWADAEIARRCHVSGSTVSRIRSTSPGLIGHDIDIRIDRDGDLFTKPNGHATKTHEAETVEPEPRFKVPPRTLTKDELREQYVAKVARKLRKADPNLKRNIESRFGTTDMTDSKRCYFFSTAFDRNTMFTAIGRAVIIGHDLKLKPVIMGHFPAQLHDVIKEAEKIGVFVMSPEAVQQETEV